MGGALLPLMSGEPPPCIVIHSVVIPTSPRGSIVKKFTLARAAALIASCVARMISGAPWLLNGSVTI